VNPDSIKVSGIPIRSKFAEQLDRKPIAKRLGLNPDIPIVLIMGGGQGLGPIKSTVKSLLKIRMDFQIITILGTNKKAVHRLKKATAKSEKKIIIMEFANNVDELMELASLIITKPGGITTAECLTKGLPMVIVNPIPGQEMRNTDFLIKKGVGIRLDDSSDIGEEIEILLKSPERLNLMSRAAYENAKPYSTLNVAKLILGKEEVQDTLTPFEENLNLENYV